MSSERDESTYMRFGPIHWDNKTIDRIHFSDIIFDSDTNIKNTEIKNCNFYNAQFKGGKFENGILLDETTESL